jgi:hypothetical protein
MRVLIKQLLMYPSDHVASSALNHNYNTVVYGLVRMLVIFEVLLSI